MSEHLAKRHVRTQMAAVLMAFGLVAAACGSGDTATTTRAAGEPASTTAATGGPTTTSAPTTTAPTTTTTEQPDEPLLLLAYGDSFATLTFWPNQYAALASQELGAEVVTDGRACWTPCGGVLPVITSEKHSALMGLARIVVVEPSPGAAMTMPLRKYLGGTCGGDDGQQCLEEALDAYEIHIGELLDATLDLTGPGATIRVTPAATWAMDAFYPDVRGEDPESFDVMLNALISFVELTNAAAEERCIGVSDVSALMNGTNYRTPMSAAHTDDQKHPNDEGSRIIAEDLHSLGYEPTPRGC